LAETEVFLFRDDRGAIPLLAWLDELPSKARAKCIDRINRLAEIGTELRRPEADYLRDGIYELRSSYQGVNYRACTSFWEGRLWSFHTA